MRESLRWGGSFAFVLALHAGAVGVALGWTEAVTSYSPPPAAVMLELAPLPAAPVATPNEAPPGPELSEVVPEPEPPPPVEMPPPVVAEVTLPEPEPPPPVDLKPPPPKPIEKKVEKKPPQPKVAAPQAAPQEAARAAAPAPGASVDPPSNTLPTWKGILLKHLERHKRYPHEAQRSRHEGITYVRFTMSRDGRVLAARVERGAGVASLDQEGLDLLQRAQPLPPLPHDQPGESLGLIVPIQFFMRR
jgi:periplasmic protein TonB